MKGPALTPASLRQRATWLRLDKINNPYSGVFDMAADTIEQLEAEVARLRGLVESAYHEGAMDESRGDGCWPDSQSLAALALPTNAPEAKDGK